jgi:hypothetical protein
MKHPLILASQSPRRKELLELAELNFITHSADIDESLDLSCDLKEELKKLALKKARASEVHHPGCIVLGAAYSRSAAFHDRNRDTQPAAKLIAESNKIRLRFHWETIAVFPTALAAEFLSGEKFAFCPNVAVGFFDRLLHLIVPVCHRMAQGFAALLSDQTVDFDAAKSGLKFRHSCL